MRFGLTGFKFCHGTIAEQGPDFSDRSSWILPPGDELSTRLDAFADGELTGPDLKENNEGSISKIVLSTKSRSIMPLLTKWLRLKMPNINFPTLLLMSTIPYEKKTPIAGERVMMFEISSPCQRASLHKSLTSCPRPALASRLLLASHWLRYPNLLHSDYDCWLM